MQQLAKLQIAGRPKPGLNSWPALDSSCWWQSHWVHWAGCLWDNSSSLVLKVLHEWHAGRTLQSQTFQRFSSSSPTTTPDIGSTTSTNTNHNHYIPQPPRARRVYDRAGGWPKSQLSNAVQRLLAAESLIEEDTGDQVAGRCFSDLKSEKLGNTMILGLRLI